MKCHKLFQNILPGFLLEIISETSQTPIKMFLQHFALKSIILSDISLPRLGKNMSIAMQNLTESPKNQLAL